MKKKIRILVSHVTFLLWYTFGHTTGKCLSARHSSMNGMRHVCGTLMYHVEGHCSSTLHGTRKLFLRKKNSKITKLIILGWNSKAPSNFVPVLKIIQFSSRLQTAANGISFQVAAARC